MEPALPRATRGLPRRPPRMLGCAGARQPPAHGGGLAGAQPATRLSFQQMFSERWPGCHGSWGHSGQSTSDGRRLPGTRAAARASPAASAGRHSRGLPREHAVSPGPGRGTAKVNVPAELGSVRPRSLACARPPSCCALSRSFLRPCVPGVPLCGDQTSSYKDARRIGSGPTRRPHVFAMTSLRTASPHCHLLVSWAEDLSLLLWGVTVGPTTAPPHPCWEPRPPRRQALGKKSPGCWGPAHGGGASRPDCSRHSPREPSRVSSGW